MLVGSEILEEFIDHMERDDLVRLRWLKRIRESGFDQALSEYRESLIFPTSLSQTYVRSIKVDDLPPCI